MGESADQPKVSARRAAEASEGSTLRDQLLELGYLQDPLARFLSRSEGGPQSLWKSYVVIGAKVGIIFGLLVFALLMIGFAAAGRFVLLSWRDLFLFHAYLLIVALPLGIAVGLSLAAAFALYTHLSRRALTKVALAARKCSVIVALSTLGYLLLIWLRLRTTLIDVGLLSDVAAAAVCAGSAWLSGRATFVAALYLGARRRRRDALEIDPPKRGLYSLLALMLLFSAGFGALLFAARPAERTPREEFRLDPETRRVVLLGIDGLEIDTVRALAAEGTLPAFAALLRDGVSFGLTSSTELHPLAWWTELSTGFPPERHGIFGPTHERPRGISGSIFIPGEIVGFREVLDHVLPLLELSRAAPFSAGHLQEKSLLEIAADAGIPAATVNWWMTHPVNSAFSAAQLSELAIWQTWSAGPQGLPAPNAATPAAMAELLARVCEHPQRDSQQPIAAAAASAKALDLSAARVADLLLQRAELRFVQIGFWGPNALHDTLRFDEPNLLRERERVAALVAHYRALDERIGGLQAQIAASDPRAVLCLVVAPPTQRGSAGPRLGAGGWCVFSAADLAGRKVGLRTRRLVDLAPTLLRVMGCPVSAEMPGESCAEELLWALPRKRISSFGPPALRPLPSVEEDRDALEMMRALGYL